LENKTGNEIVIIPNRYLEIPKYDLQKSSQKLGKASYAVVEPPTEEEIKVNEKQEKDQRLEPAVKAILPSKTSRKGKNSSIFGFFKNLITNAPDTGKAEETSEEEEVLEKVETPSTNEIEDRSNRSRNRNRNRNRNRRPDNRNTNPDSERKANQREETKNITQSSNDMSTKTEMLVKTNSISENNQVLDKKTSDANIPKEKQRKRQPLPNVDLTKVGLNLVETKAAKIKEEVIEQIKPAKKKVADWQKKSAEVSTGKIEMIETKKKAPKTKSEDKPKKLPKKKVKELPA